MRHLLDTHTLIWFLEDDNKLSAFVQSLLDDGANELLVSIASIWEIAVKVSINKLSLSSPFEDVFPYQLIYNSIDILEIDINHLKIVSNLPLHHRDPFDKLLIAQCMSEGIPIVSTDSLFDQYGIKRIW